VKSIVKGRTTCPKCNHTFILDIPKSSDPININCPKCNYEFTIRTKKSDSSDAECSWEEHGEPRKTILSKIKPRTNKPFFAAILLIIVFSIGMTTAGFNELFLETNAELGNSFGIIGNLEFELIDQNNNSIKDVNVNFDEDAKSTDNNGKVFFNETSLGIKTITFSKEGYSEIKQEFLILPFVVTYHEIQMDKNDKTKIIPFDVIGCSLIFAILSIFSLLGAISCFKRRYFDVAVAGSIIGFFSFGFFFIGSILSLIALIIIIRSREEFNDGKQGKTF